MVPLPEWLEERATDAPTMVRVVADTVDTRLRCDYPRVLEYPDWHRFRQIGTIGGCVALALRLHVDVPEEYRTPLELAMRESLELGFPGSAALYEDCVCFVREAILEVERPKRAVVSTVLISTWVFGVIAQRAPLEEDAPLVAELAQLYRREAEAYWVAGHGA